MMYCINHLEHIMTFTSIPTWAIPATPSRFALYETIALLGLEDHWIRLSAADQRSLMGANVFGKQSIKVDPMGVVTVTRSSCFGLDSETAQYKPHHVHAAIHQHKKLAPGLFGPSYL
jgi:hypothetical protein